jgi:hypothetical protein
MMLLSVFSRPRMNGPVVQPRVEEVDDRVQLGQPILDRRPGQRHAVASGQ